MGRYFNSLNGFNVRRALFGIALFLSILVAPFWVTLVLSVLGVILFESYFESIIASLIVDSIFGFSGSGLWSVQFGYSITFFISFFLFEYIVKPNLAYYKR